MLKSKYIRKADRLILTFLAIGVVLILTGGFLRPKELSGVLLLTFIYLGAFLVIASVIALVLGERNEK